MTFWRDPYGWLLLRLFGRRGLRTLRRRLVDDLEAWRHALAAVYAALLMLALLAAPGLPGGLPALIGGVCLQIACVACMAALRPRRRSGPPWGGLPGMLVGFAVWILALPIWMLTWGHADAFGWGRAGAFAWPWVRIGGALSALLSLIVLAVLCVRHLERRPGITAMLHLNLLAAVVAAFTALAMLGQARGDDSILPLAALLALVATLYCLGVQVALLYWSAATRPPPPLLIPPPDGE